VDFFLIGNSAKVRQRLPRLAGPDRPTKNLAYNNGKNCTQVAEIIAGAREYLAALRPKFALD
jgi:hypothetical protein